jgi:hypothetical protein
MIVAICIAVYLVFLVWIFSILRSGRLRRMSMIDVARSPAALPLDGIIRQNDDPVYLKLVQEFDLLEKESEWRTR